MTAGALRLHAEARPLHLDSGGVLDGVRVAYRTWGHLSRHRDNAVVVCHALTGNADADSWWGPLFGPGQALDPARDFVVCSNVLGSCYGTTGPASPRAPGRGRWGPDFPEITVRDMVRLQMRLMDALGVHRIKLVIGGSLGGMQVLEWGLLDPERILAMVPIATSGRHSAWCIGLSEAQRQAIVADPAWQGGHYAPTAPPASGLAVARMIAMCSYRSPQSFADRFGRSGEDRGGFAVESYLRHQGRKLVDRFDALSYLTLTRAMDSHDLARGRGEYHQVLGSLAAPALVMSVPSDLLYLPQEQEELAAHLPNAELVQLDSPHGHDAFLIEAAQVSARVVEFRQRVGC